MTTRIQINITHIVNPSQFYYMKDDALLSNDYDIDYNLQKYFRQNPAGSTSFSPKINEIVAVFNISDKRWVRACVDEVYQFYSTAPKYVLWAIDYGKLIVSKGSHIRRLPDEFQKTPSDIFFGGVINLLPAEMTLDFMDMTQKLETRNKWAPKSCELFQKLKENSEQCFFQVEEIREGQYFGKLEMVNCLNKKFNINQILCKENLALECEKVEFFDKIKRFQLNNNKRWISTDGDCKLLSYANNYLTDIENNLCSSSLEKVDPLENVTEKNTDTDQISSSFKIKEWNERNKRLISSERDVDHVKNFENEEEDSLSNLDSVSVAENKLENLRNMKIKTKRLTIDDQNSEYGSKMKLAGSHSKIRKESFIPQADDTFSILSNPDFKLDAKLTELNRSTGVGIATSKMLSCEVKSTISDLSVKSYEKYVAERQKEKLLTNKSNPNDDNLSMISDYSSISQKRFLAERVNRSLGKIPQKTKTKEMKNEETLSKISQENYLNERDLKPKVAQDYELKKSFNDTTQSIISDSSVTSKERFLAQRRNRSLGQTTRTDENPKSLKNSENSLKLPIEKETSIIQSTELLNSKVQSDISDFSMKSREKFLEQKKRNMHKRIEKSGSNDISDGNILQKNQDSNHSHQLATTKSNELPSQIVQKNIIEKFDENLRSDQTIKSIKSVITPAVPLASTGNISMNNSASFKSDVTSLTTKPSESKQKNNELKENQRIILPDGYNLPSIQKFRKENQKPKQNKSFSDENQKKRFNKNSCEKNQTTNKNSVQEKVSLPKHQNQINNNTKRNESNSSRNCNNERIKLEDINEVCLSDVSDYSKNLVLLHGAQLSAPVYKLEKAKFSEIVYKGMRQLSNSSVYRIQQCSWNHILEGSSLVIISRPQTGKTQAYLPAICSLIHMEKEDEEVENDRGPICIIIAATRNDAVNLKYRCKTFICNNGKYNDHIAFFANPENENDYNKTLTDLFVGKDILICTPQCLHRLFYPDLDLSNSGKKQFLVKWFSKKRLKHFVIDNYDLWNKEKRDILAKCVKELKLKCEENIQLVVTSNLWEPSLERFFKLKSFKNPLLCIGAHIEAAIYSGTHFSFKIVSNLKKIDYIRRFINKYTQERLIVVCSTDEESNYVFEELNKFFMCIKLTIENSGEEIENFSKRWRNGNIHESELLICTDEQLNLLKIQNAYNLVHYSLSNSWSKFSLRFSVMLDSYIDRVKLNFEETSEKPPNCLILLDEYNDDQLPKLISFLERINCDIPLEIKELALKKEQEIENRMNITNPKICSKFLEFGNYHDKTICNLGRHVLNKHDQTYDNIPAKGIIKYDIINVFSPVHYAIRILNYKSSLNSNWKDYNKASKYAVFLVNLSTHFANASNHIIHYPPKLYDVCIVSEDNDFYRAQIIRIIKSPPNSFRKSENVECKLLDNGRTEIYPVSCLLSLPDKYREFPYQAIDMRLTGVISVDEEDEWDGKLKKTIKEWFKRDKSSEIAYFISQIDFTILNTLFVPEIVLSEKCSESITIHQVFVKKNLIKKNLVKRNAIVTENLKAMAVSLKILRESNQDEKSDEIDSSSSIKDLNKEKVLTNGNIKKTEEAIVEQKFENPCSSVDSPSDLMSNNNMGISPSTNFSGTPISGLRARPIRGLRKSNLKCKETWCNLVEDEYTEVICSLYYKPNEFYVSIKKNNHERNELYKKIDSYIAENPKHITHTEIGINCIGKLNKEYERCKIIEIVHDPNLKKVKVKVFFVDVGCIACRSIDSLYLSTKEIVEYLPYQAIRCNLTGGIWNNIYADDIYDELLQDCEHLFVLPKSREELKENVVLKNYCYNVILIDCTTDTDVLINKKIIELGYGEEDIKEINHENDELNSSDSEENWDNQDSGKVFIYKPPKVETEINFLNNEDDEERVFDVNFDDDELNEFKKLMGLPETVKFLPADDDVLEKNEIKDSEKKDTEKKPSKKSCTKKIQDKSINLAQEEKTVNIMEEHEKRESDMSNLMLNTNRPFVSWKQSEDYIRLEISAPDVDDYYLNVTTNHLYFAALIKSEPKQLDIQLFGCIRPQYTFHEIRGLNVVVVLLKTINDKKFLWPRLTEINEKNVLIKYDPNAIADVLGQEDDMPENTRVDYPVMNEDESSSDENGSDDFFTNDPIYNEDDDHDPFADGF